MIWFTRFIVCLIFFSLFFSKISYFISFYQINFYYYSTITIIILPINFLFFIIITYIFKIKFIFIIYITILNFYSLFIKFIIKFNNNFN